MADQISTLGLAVDTTQVKSAEKTLDSFAQAGTKAATAAESLEQAMRDTAPAAEAATAAFNKAAPAATATKRLSDEAEKLAKQTKQSAYQAQQLSFQLNDLFVQIASGGNPLTALIQQGSQLSGTFGGVGAAARAAGGFVIGFINPVTLAVGAVAALAIAYEKGSQEGREFNKTLILTGNQAGTTADHLASMAKQVNQLGAGTVGRAAEVLNMLAGSGKVAAENLAAFTNAALQMERSGGPAVEDTVKAFTDLGKAPLQASLKLNESMNYLTRSTYEQVRALERQGRTVEAAQVAQKAYADALQQRTPEMEKNLGLLERAWRGVKDASKEALDAALNVGRPQTLEDIAGKLAAVRAQRVDVETNGSGFRRRSVVLAELDSEEKKLQKQYDIQLGIQAVEGLRADLSAEQAKQTEARNKFDNDGLQFLTRRKQLEDAIIRVRNEGVAAGAKEKEIQERIAAVRRQFDPGASEARALDRIDDTKRNLNSLVEAYQSAEQVLEANRQAGLVGEKDYYDAKIGFIKLNAEAQRRLIEEDNKAQRERLKAPDLTTAETVAIQKQIKDNAAEVIAIQNRAATASQVFVTQQAAAQRQLAAAYVESRNAAEQYLQSLQRANASDLSGAGLGSEERSRRSGRNQIADKFADERARLDAQIEAAKTRNGGELTDEQAAQFTNELNLIAEFKDKALAEYDTYYAKRREQEANAAYGAAEALANWAESNRNAARSMQEAYERTFSSLEDTLTTFFKSGKLNAKSLVDTILTELARLEAKRFLSSLSDGLGSVLGTLFGGRTDGGAPVTDLSWASGGRAIGGPVSAGQTYEVNERDIPEIARVGGRDYLTMGGQGGKVMPLDGQIGGPSFTFNIGAGVQRGELVALIPEMTRQIKASIQGDMGRPGGRS